MHQSDLVETLHAPDLAVTYARLTARAGGGRPTRTPHGQVGVAFTGHHRLVFRVHGLTRRVNAPPGAVYLTSQGAIDWVEVHGPTEAIEIQVAPRLLESTGADGARDALGVHDAVVAAAASSLRAVHLQGAGLPDVWSSTVAHRLSGHIARRYAGVAPPSGQVPRLSWRDVESVYRLIRDEPAAVLTLDVLAAAVHRSVFDFARTFREATGMAPHRFVTLVRMHHASELIRAGATISDVAGAVGYSSRYHFRRQFRAAVGCDPLTVRAAR